MFLHKKKLFQYYNSMFIVLRTKINLSADEPPEENWIGDNEETSQKTLICLFKQEYIAKSR